MLLASNPSEIQTGDGRPESYKSDTVPLDHLHLQCSWWGCIPSQFLPRNALSANAWSWDRMLSVRLSVCDVGDL